MKFTCEGIISVGVGKTKDNLRTELTFKNLITDAGLNRLGSHSFGNCTGTCKVGNGTSTPVVGDTDLAGNYKPSTARVSSSFGNSSGTPVWYSFNRYNYVFAVGDVVGDMTEIGFFQDSVMFSRSLLKDLEGNPTVLTILADEQLFVTYEVRKYVPTKTTGTFNLKINGVDTEFSYTMKAAEVDTTDSGGYWYSSNGPAGINHVVFYESNVLGDITGVPTGTTTATGAAVAATYVPDSFTSVLSCVADPDVANFTTGIGAAYFSKGFQVSFSPQIEKNSDRRLVLPFQISWGRA